MSRCSLLPLRSPIQLMICLGVLALATPFGAARAEAPGAVYGPPAPAPAPAPPSPAEEAARQQVRTLVGEAGQLLDRGDKAGAVAKLLQAQRLRADPSLDYNLGVAYGEWGRPAEAAAAFERFLAGVKAEVVTGDRIEDARKRLDAYRPQLGRVTVQVVPAGAPPRAATVLIDNRTLGPAPLRDHWLAPGPHEVRVTAAGARDYIVSVPVTAGEEQLVSAQLVALVGAGGVPLVPPPRDLPPEAPPLYRRWWLWTATAAGVALAAGLIGAGAAGSFNHKAPGTDLDALDVAR